MNFNTSGFKLELHNNNKLCYCDWHDCLLVDKRTVECFPYLLQYIVFKNPSLKRIKQMSSRWRALEGDRN